MRLAILSFYSGKVERGVENWTHELATRLSNRDNTVNVFQNQAVEDTKYKVIVNKVRLNWQRKDISKGFLRRFFIDYRSLIILFWTLKNIPDLIRGKYDIVIPTNGGWQVAIVRLTTWLTRTKMVVVGHSGRGWDERNNLFSFPDVFVALSNQAQGWARRVNPVVKTAVIADGVDMVKFSPKGKKIDIDLKKPIVLAAAAAAAGKRLDLVIKAVAENKKCSLLLLTAGDQFENLKKLGEKLLGKRFKIISVSYSDMPKHYRSVDLFTMASWQYEAFGMVFIEAMACNLPIVANDDPIRREIIGDAGFFIDPENTQEYSRVLSQALKKSWGNNPYRQAKKYSWDKIANQYEKLFQDIVKR